MTESKEMAVRERIEVEARKAPTLVWVLLALSLLAAPVVFAVSIMAFREWTSGPLPDSTYGRAAGMTSTGLFMALFVFLTAVVRQRQRKVSPQLAAKVPLQPFQWGLAVVGAAWRSWWTALAGLGMAIYLLIINFGFDPDMRGRFWGVMLLATAFFGFLFALVTLCVWLGRRVHKQRAAR